MSKSKSRKAWEELVASNEHLAKLAAGHKAYWEKKRAQNPPKPKKTKEQLSEEKRQRLLANPIRKKGQPLSEATRLKIKESCAKSAKFKANTANMLADPDRVKKVVKANKARHRIKVQERKAQEKRRLKAQRAPLGRLIALDGRDQPRYYATWVSPVEPSYKVTVRTLKALRFGRPRDPWGNFMKPLHPEHIFGMPIRNGEQLVYPPNKQPTLQNGVRKHSGSPGVDEAEGTTGADGSGNVGENPSNPGRVYRRYRHRYT
jgi:uncharacterized short protein YbdD (DUF466 family)